MPHFENIDQYEAKNPKSGQKEIIPIAPHSMQAVDYRLNKERKSEAPQRKPKPDFTPVEFDPISVRQMEKEFKQAARADARRAPRPSIRTRLKKFREFIASLFGKKSEQPARRNRSQRRKPGPRPARKSARQTKDESGNAQNRNRRSRNRRSRNRPKGGGKEGTQSENKGGNRENPSGKKRSNRSRRGRRPPNRQNQRSGGNKGQSKSDS